MADFRVCRECGKIFTRGDSSKSNKNICNRCQKKKYPPSPAAKARQDAKRAIRKKFKDRPYLIYRKGHCEQCGFIPMHECQLSVDHIDGNNKNNELANLQTLCHNCHSLKTYVNRDWEAKSLVTMQISFNF
jgi:hypothetical protein